MADWSVLPSDILGEIALKLDFIEDFIYFSAVCHSWNHASSMVKPQWSRRAHKPTPPWLLLPEPEPGINDDTTQENSSCRKILSININRCYEVMLPQISGKRCWGSSYGWIVMFGSDEEIELFNPITKAHLSLPSLKTLPDHPLTEDHDNDADFGRDSWALKYLVSNIFVFNMSRNDNNVGDSVVTVIHQPLNQLSFGRPGDRAWTPVLTRGTTPNQVHQVMYWKGLVLILYKDRTFAYLDINSTLIGSATPVEAKNYYSLVPVRFVGISQAGLGDGTLYTMGVKW